MPSSGYWTESTAVDGVLVHTENGSRGALPVTAGKIMMNLYPGIGVDGWLGPFDGKVPQVAQYDWVKFTPQSAATATATRTPTAAVRRGDANGNGTIDIVDALMTAQYYVGLNPANFLQTNADVNCDGSITIVDALMIAQYYVGLLSNFNC